MLRLLIFVLLAGMLLAAGCTSAPPKPATTPPAVTPPVQNCHTVVDDVPKTELKCSDVIYTERDKVLAGESMRDTVMTMLEDEVEALAHDHLRTSPLDPAAFRAAIDAIVPELPGDALADPAATVDECVDDALGIIDERYQQLASALARLARCYLAAGRADEVKRALEKSAKAMPHDPAIVRERSKIRLAAGDAVGARNDLAQAIEANPQDVDLLIEAARLAAMWMRPIDAETKLRRALELRPQDETIRDLLASALLDEAQSLSHGDRERLFGYLEGGGKMILSEPTSMLTKASKMPGVDGQTVSDYGQHLEEKLTSLLQRAKRGNYVAPPVKRVHLPKNGSNETRPIGMPTTEDKVLQRAVAMLLEPIYEEAFYDFSYGFRPGRSPHQALEAFWQQATSYGVRWVLEVDIRKYFDSVNRSNLMTLVGQRMGDGVVLRLLSKWLNAGVMEEGQVHYPEAGTPQGGVISPLLSNIYLHEVFDRWFAEVVRERMRGRVFVVRFADDLVMGFTHRQDAERVQRVIFQRFEKYGLQLHPEKTRLVPFGRPEKAGLDGDGPHEPGTFDFLGFTHYWGKTRKGYWVIRRKTAAKRLRRTLRAMGDWFRQHRHLGMAEQFQMLVRKLAGHYAYYGITGNGPCLEQVRTAVQKLWYKWLRRRSRNPGRLTWEWMDWHLKETFVFPAARVVHSIYQAKS